MNTSLIIREADHASKESVLSYIARELEFPEYYGHNLDALYDCLTDIEEPVSILVDPEQQPSAWFRQICTVLRDAAEENGYLEVFVPERPETDATKSASETAWVSAQAVTLTVRTSTHTEMLDITARVQQAVRESGVRSGICTVFVPHTTAAVTINENADPDVKRDMMMKLGKIVPWEDGYRHYEGNSAAHLKASLFGFSEQIIIEDGRLQLGTWQGVYFCEFDGPRSRKVMVKVMGER